MLIQNPSFSHTEAEQHDHVTNSLLEQKPRKRRPSTNHIPGEIRGDTGAAALSTLNDQSEDAKSAAEVAKRNATEKALRPNSKRRKAKSLFRRWKSFSMRHTWVNPLILVLTILALYAFNPGKTNPLYPAIFLSYPLPRSAPGEPIQYGKGSLDFAFVAFYTVVLSFSREFLMQRIIRPIAIRNGIKSRAKQSRFMEQFYTAIYFAVFGPYGLYVMKKSPVWYFNTKGMFEGFPHRQHDGLFKAYYLLQAAYWCQQALVLMLQLEKPRKDFKELVGHHIITIALIGLSYRFHFTYIGLAVYITHDISDFFLASSKVLNYLSSPIVAPYFAFFAVAWAYLRHYLNLHILYAVLTDFATVGPFELDWDNEQYKCWISQYVTFGLLACLQSVNLFWFFMILRIAKRYVLDNGLEDERSDYEGEDEAAEEESTAEKKQRLAAVMSQTKGNGTAVTSGTDASTRSTTPQVLLNGVPVDDSTMSTPPTKPSKTKKKKETIEITSTQHEQKKTKAK